MRKRWGWVGVLGGVAGLTLSAMTGVPASYARADPDLEPLTTAGTAVPLELAGELVLWGDDTYGQTTVPAALADTAFSQVLVIDDAVLALTAGGRVVGWGSNQRRIEQIPDAVVAEKVAQIAYSPSGFAGAVTRDGRVLVWGVTRQRPTPLNDMPAGLTGVVQLNLSDEIAVALKQDGTVVVWGDDADGVQDVPDGLRATQIVMSATTATALTTDGSVVQWGSDFQQVGRPASVTEPGSVKAITNRTSGVMAWLADDSLVTWGYTATPVPATVAAAQPLLLADSAGYGYAMVDQDRVIRQWSPDQTPDEDPTTLPDDLSGRPISHLTLGSPFLESGGAVVTRLLKAEAPRVAGSVRVGAVLTGVPGTFSADPDSVQSQWLVGGAPVAGTQLTVTSAMVGKTIAYRSTATKAGEDPVTATSAGVVVPKPGPSVVRSSTEIVSVKVAKKAAKVDVAGKVSATRAPTGKASVTITKGSKVIVTKTVSVPAAGSVKLTVKKFGKLAIKKTGSKSKTGYRGTYLVRITYLGNPQVAKSVATKKFTVK